MKITAEAGMGAQMELYRGYHLIAKQTPGQFWKACVLESGILTADFEEAHDALDEARYLIDEYIQRDVGVGRLPSSSSTVRA
jgi:hypothetical protein